MMKIIRGTLAADEGLNTIIRHYDLPLPVLNLYQATSLIGGKALESFVDEGSLDYDKKGPSLGNLALAMTIEVTGIEERSDIGPIADLPESIPILNNYGQMEEKFLKMGREAYLIDTIGNGEWPMHLRTIALPKSDSIFVERSSHTISRVASTLGDKLVATLKMLRKEDF